MIFYRYVFYNKYYLGFFKLTLRYFSYRKQCVTLKKIAIKLLDNYHANGSMNKIKTQTKISLNC